MPKQSADDTCAPPSTGALFKDVVQDAVVIAGTYAILSWSLGASDTMPSPSLDKSLTFFSIFVPLSFAVKALDLEYADQLARVALFQLGVRIFNILSAA